MCTSGVLRQRRPSLRKRRQRQRPQANSQKGTSSTTLQMEAAFCAYLGRTSAVSAQLVRWLQLAAWLTALCKWFYHSAINHPFASQTLLEWAAGGTLVFLVVVAGTRCFGCFSVSFHGQHDPFVPCWWSFIGATTATLTATL